jgi:hypothetical protein
MLVVSPTACNMLSQTVIFLAAYVAMSTAAPAEPHLMMSRNVWPECHGNGVQFNNCLTGINAPGCNGDMACLDSAYRYCGKPLPPPSVPTYLSCIRADEAAMFSWCGGMRHSAPCGLIRGVESLVGGLGSRLTTRSAGMPVGTRALWAPTSTQSEQVAFSRRCPSSGST